MKRLPAFSLLEVSIVLLIVGGVMATTIPLIARFQRQFESQNQLELALKSLGAYVAMNKMLPLPDPIHTEGDIVRGVLPYTKLGISKKGTPIQYAVDRNLTTTNVNYNFCNPDWKDHFDHDFQLEKDLGAFELSINTTKIFMTRNNFYTQYCGGVCQAIIIKRPKKGTQV